MLSTGLIITVASLYLGGLFLLAFITDRRARRGAANFINSPVVYTLSLAVYCTSWTFYGAVGSAARNGLEFLTIYLGPTIVLMGWPVVLRKLVRISNAQRITSIADFISARYGKSSSISVLVTIIALIGVTPYIALQLKAVAASFNALSMTPGMNAAVTTNWSLFADTGFWVAVSMVIFVILFGTRNLGADEHHPGVVAAIAFESIVKLFSLAAIALLVLYGLNDGLKDLFARAAQNPDVQRLYTFENGFEARWIVTTFLSAAAIICLPRQFQVAVVENSNERHLITASWLFPLYLMLISLFVIPIALGGMTILPGNSNPDLYVLNVPLATGNEGLALLAFLGGLSAATSMVIVASIALAIMISNHLVTPLLLRIPTFSGFDRGDFSTTLQMVRRLSILAIFTLGFIYYRVTGTGNPLASIGLISFAGVAQFVPALIGGIYWRNGTKAGATAGLFSGFALWVYTLLVPSIAGAGWGFEDIAESGLWSVALLKPDALMGLTGWDPLVHGLFWSLTVNTGLYVLVSVLTRATPLERLQSALFVDAFRTVKGNVEGALQRSATTNDLVQLTSRIIGPQRAHEIFREYARRQGRKDPLPAPEPALVAHVERQLAGNIGAASARTLISRIVKGERITLDAVISLLDETQQVIRYSRELEHKSHELERTAAKLRNANEQLTALDKMKDDFLSQVSHELRTPMTSIRSFSEILGSTPDLNDGQAKRFIAIIQNESERLTRLLDEILELGRLESGQLVWTPQRTDAAAVVRSGIEAMRGLTQEHNVTIHDELGDAPIPVVADADRLKQVCINLLSNAVKFTDSDSPAIWVTCAPAADGHGIEIHVRDNGVGIPPETQKSLFRKFSRGWNAPAPRREGSGLGLSISKRIMQIMGGDLRLVHSDGTGTCFAIRFAAEKPPAASDAERLQVSEAS